MRQRTKRRDVRVSHTWLAAFHDSSLPSLPQVFFDVAIGGKPAGRIIFELFSDITPKTAENFRVRMCAR